MVATQRMKQANAKADSNITKRGQVSKVCECLSGSYRYLGYSISAALCRLFSPTRSPVSNVHFLVDIHNMSKLDALSVWKIELIIEL